MIDKADFEYLTTIVSDYLPKLRGKSVFITGATGILGKWFLEYFSYLKNIENYSIEITALSRSPSDFILRNPHLKNQGIDFVKGDIRSYRHTSDRSFEYFIHGATDVVAQAGAADVLDTCTAGTANALSLAKAMGTKHFLLISSGAVYGKVPDGHGAIDEEFLGVLNHLSPEAAYAQGKRNAELMCVLEASEGKMQIPIARCFAMVGPYLPLNKHFAIGNFVEAALLNHDIEIKGDGTPVRSYLYMADVIARLLLLLLAGRTAVPYNIGGKIPISIADLAQKVMTVLESDKRINTANQAIHGAHANVYYPDTHRLDDEFRLRSAINLDDAILRTAKWYRSHTPNFTS